MAMIASGQTTKIAIVPARIAGYVILNDPNQGTLQFAANCTDASGAVANCTSTVTWHNFRPTTVPPSATMSTPGLFTGTTYGFMVVWATLPTPDVSITGYTCATTTSCVFTTSTPPTAVVGSFYFIQGLTATGGLITGGQGTPPAPNYTFPRFDGRVLAVTAVNATTAPYTFTATVPTATANASPVTDTGTAYISSGRNWSTNPKELVNTFHPTPLNPTDPTGSPPVPNLPNGITSNNTWPPSYSGTVYDTTFTVPTGGTTWTPACNAGVGVTYIAQGANSLEAAVTNYNPGDVILLNHTCTWTVGTRTLVFNAKSNPNHLYTYVMSDAYASLPPPGPGTRTTTFPLGVNPASRINPVVDSGNMPTLLNTLLASSVGSTFEICGMKLVADFTGCPVNSSIPGGYIRFVGLHLAGKVAGANPLISAFIQTDEQRTGPVPTITNVIFDRLWIDGGPRIGQPGATAVVHGVVCNASPCALIDSYCNNIWASGYDAQCITGYFFNGPLKVNNNFIEGYGEGLEIGGGGGALVQWLPSDVENINNYSLHSQEMIQPCMVGTGGIVVDCKNLWEYKFGQRVLIDHNTFEGEINSAQQFAMALTPRSNQSGLNAVINDYTVTNNYWKNVSGALGTVAWNGPAGPGDPLGNGEINGGESVRNAFINNAITACQNTSTTLGCSKGLFLWSLAAGLQGWTFEHNTSTMQPPFVNNMVNGTVFIGQSGTTTVQPPQYHNLWRRCNVELRPLYLAGAGGGFVGAGSNPTNIQTTNGDPAGNAAARLTSNIFYGLATDPATPNYLAGNIVLPGQVPTFIAPFPALPQNYQLDPAYLAGLSPAPAACFDGHPIGVNGVVGENPPPNTRFAIGGTIGGATGVTVTLSGFNAATLANVSGSYNFPGLMNGTYTVTPTLFGYDFTPVTATVTVSQANVTQNFTAVPGTQYTISGNISGSVSSGVTVSLAGPQNLTTSTDATGHYSFTVFNGTYTVTPSSTGNSFTPSPPVTVYVINANEVQDFTSAAIPVYQVSGRITNNALPQSGVTVAATGQTSVTTDANGDYIFMLPNGTYTITPALANYAFTPAHLNVTVAGAAIASQNFTSIQIGGPTVSGNTILPAASLTIYSSTGIVASKGSDAAGNYSFPGIANGSYLLRAIGAGMVCTPQAVPFVMNGANVVINFHCVAATSTVNITGTITGTGAAGVVLLAVTGSTTGWAYSSPYLTTQQYSFNGFAPGGTYTVTPILSGYSFSPASRTVTPTANSLGNDFTATAVAVTNYTISGAIGGEIQAGVTLNLAGGATASTVSASDGTYSFANLPNGIYSVTPTLTGYVFSPASYTVVVSGGNISNQNFTAAFRGVPSYTISGTISGVVASGILVQLSGSSTGQTFTDALGNYSFTEPSGSYTVTPVLVGYRFNPTSISVTVTTVGLGGNNFVSQAGAAAWNVGSIGPGLGRAVAQPLPKKKIPKKEQPK